MANDTGEENLRKELDILQSVIDVSATTLVGLRTQCATSAELTRQEIRTLEGKLIKLFSQQLVAKSKLKNGIGICMPDLKQWLQIVGLETSSITAICQKISSVEELQEKTEHELKTLLTDKNAGPEELCRLFRALHNLKKYTDILKRGDQTSQETQDTNLSWDSWDRNYVKIKHGLSPRATRSRATRASVPSEENLFNNNHKASATIAASPSVSSINSLNASSMVLVGPPLTPPGYNTSNVFSPPKERGKEKKFPTTPPAKRKQLINNSTALLTDTFPLTKSKSHESQLADTKSKNNGDLDNINETRNSVRRGRLPTEPGPETMGFTSPVFASPIKSPPYNSIGNDSDDSSYKSMRLQVPKSPQTPPIKVGMAHQIAHRFTKKFKLNGFCGMCGQRIFGKALKCSECKYVCHRECQEKVPPSCGLPPGYLTAFIQNFEGTQGSISYSPNSGQKKRNSIVTSLNRVGHRKGSHPSTAFNNTGGVQPPDSSSNTSSCNSSTPSSPAVHNSTTPHGSQKQFHFPDIMHSEPIKEVTLETHPLPALSSPRHKLVSSQLSRESDKTVSQASNSTSSDSVRTPVRLDSQDSQVSDTDTLTDAHMARQNSLSLKEWDIPYDELKFFKEVGTGRFGTVYRGFWHGDVAIKHLNVKDDKTLEQFKMEVAIFRKTRHENLILFMGACMKPPKLAIVTSFSKGNTLYTHIHLRKDKFNINRTTTMAQQICQGMGYLHAKGIVHKDLKTKNIFLENGKVVITDFGLFSVTKLCFGHRIESLSIPPGWLCYLAPEMMRALDAHRFHEKELPFSRSSDVYAFGTVWYELLCGEWPFKNQLPEAVIWQVGRGIKQPLANLQASAEVKDILMLCWQFREEKRPDFQKLSDILGKLPKKKLERSPSHPVHLSRSAESVF
ncbi:kinase suppressor of Ras 2 [Euwallacea fornicatus]|uniref:kinase suppressor of Ras 2 n=1 Tax=Euwallacea fornicatus TaxID=995702 RepID=UPI003390056C